MNLPAELRALYDAAQAAVPLHGDSAEGVLDPCGLLLEIPPVKAWADWCTPSNVLTFATTGGDSVHYSYMVDERLPGDVCPIVMTMPCDSGRSLVVAENFHEFFCLGYHVGWFSLEQLVYQPEWAVDFFNKPHPDLNELACVLMPLLRKALQMQPLPLQLERIDALNEKYKGLLLIPEFPQDSD